MAGDRPLPYVKKIVDSHREICYNDKKCNTSEHTSWITHSKTAKNGWMTGFTTSVSALDVHCLSDEALANAECIFHDLKHERTLPFNELADDPGHHTLDGRLLR